MDQPSLPKLSRPIPPFKALLVAVGAIIVLFTVFLAGYFINLKCPFRNGGSNSAYQAGWNAARAKLELSGLLRPEPAEIFNLTGTITAVVENKISLKANQIVVNPLAEQAPEGRTVIINSQTKIVKLTNKTREKFSEEEEQFRKILTELAPGAQPPEPPSPFGEEEIKLTDLKTGDVVSVVSDKNIKFAAEFAAGEIRLTPTSP